MSHPGTPQTAAPDPMRPRARRRVSGTVSLGSWSGIPLASQWSVVVVLAVFADVLAATVLPAARPGLAAAQYWGVGVLTAVAFMLTVLLHELGHAVVARHYGMQVRGITLWMLGGATELEGAAPSPRAEAFIAGAGPATSIGLGIVAGALAWFAGPAGLVGVALGWLAVVSVALGLFNLLPGSPLDGGRILHAAIWWQSRDSSRADAAATLGGRLIGSAMLGLGILEIAASPVTGAWLALVGWTVLAGASAERRGRQSGSWRGVRAGQVMTRPAGVLNDWWTVEYALARLPELDSHGIQDDCYALVDFESGATGALSRRQLDRVPAADRADVRLRDVAATRTAPALLVTEAAAMEFVARALPAHAGVAVVTDGAGRPLGIITRAGLSRHFVRAAAPGDRSVSPGRDADPGRDAGSGRDTDPGRDAGNPAFPPRTA